MIYFAYGSNLHVEQMARRCPRAKPIQRFKLHGWRLVFRGVADCVPDAQSDCWGGVWRITPDCERELDVYEGVRSGMYWKDYIPIKPTARGEDAMLIYRMNSDGIMPPSEYYFRVIEQGYRDFDMPKDGRAALRRALRASWDDKAPSWIEHQRHSRNGRPRLATRGHAGHASDRLTNHAGY